MKGFWIELQKKLATLLKLEPLDISKIEHIVGVDVSYKNKKAVAVVQNFKSGKIIEIVSETIEEEFPYVPGLFCFREGPAVVKVLSKTKTKYELILVDGHGYAHPRRAGLASIVGLLLDKPSIGVAKNLLIGKVKDKNRISPILDKDEIIGYRIKGKERTFFVSPGHKIDLESVLKFFETTNYEYPLVLKMADKLSKR